MFRFCAGRTAIAARKITNEVKNVRIGSIKDVAGSGFCLRSRLIVDLSYLEFGIPSIFGIRISSFAAAPSGPRHMCSITLSPNCEHLISVAPSINRAKS